MSKTHTLASGTINNMAQAPQPAVQEAITEQTASATPKISGAFDFVELLASVASGRRFTMWMTANALNNFIIGNIQSHLRRSSRQQSDNAAALRAAGLDDTGINLWNAQMAAVDEMLASDANREEQGFQSSHDPLDVAERLVNIRAYMAAVMRSHAQGPGGMPQSIRESIAYRLRGAPIADDRKLAAVHQMTQIPMEVLRKLDLDAQLKERKQLIEQMDSICQMADDMAWKAVMSEAEVEQAFDELPVHVQYRLIGNITRALKVACDSEIKALIRFGRVDSIANRVIISSVLDGYKVFFSEFGAKHSDALLAYEQTGGRLPELELLLADKQ